MSVVEDQRESPSVTRPAGEGDWRRMAGQCAIVLVCYCCAQMISTWMRISPDRVSPIWLPLGFMTGVYVVARPGTWLLFALTAIFAQALITITVTIPLPQALLITTMAQCTAVLIAALVRLSTPSGRVLSPYRLVALIIFGLTVTEAVMVLPATLILAHTPVGAKSSFASILEQTTVNGPLSILVVTPVVSAVAGGWQRLVHAARRRTIEAVSRLTLVVIASIAAFWINDGKGYHQSLVLLPLPILLWSALSFRELGVTVDFLTLSIIACFGIKYGHGPFASLGAEEGTFALQLHVLALGLPVLLFAAVVSERRVAEEAVRAKERLFRTFIEKAPVPIVLVPSPDQSPIYFNPAFTRVFGYTPQDIRKPDDWWPLIYPDERYRAQRLAMWHSLVGKLHDEGGSVDAQEAEMRTKDGQMRYAQVRIAMAGEHRMSFINDLTARRHAEAALRLTQHAVDHNPVIIYRVNMEGQFVYANEAASQQLGYSLEEILQRHIWDVAQPLSESIWPQRSAHLRELGGTAFETVFMRKGGTSFPVEVRAHYLEFSGQHHFVSFAFDISVRKAAEEAARAYTHRIASLATELTRAEERQRRELATVLHDDVGQNLFAAMTQLVAIRNQSDGKRAEIEKVVSLLNHVSQETRKLTFELCPPVLHELGLAPALQRLTELFTARYSVPCTLTGSGNGPSDLNSRGLAYHAVRELLTNIAKHAGARSVSVHLEQEKDTMVLTVADDGRGFDPASLGPGKGGFGLFQLRERIALLGGQLSVHSRSGEGCRVELRLPLG